MPGLRSASPALPVVTVIVLVLAACGRAALPAVPATASPPAQTHTPMPTFTSGPTAITEQPAATAAPPTPDATPRTPASACLLPAPGCAAPAPFELQGPDPIHVQVHPGDAASAVTVEPSGAVITVTAAGGAFFRLSVPANALLSTQPLTLTVVSAVEGLAGAGELAAVRLDPPGLKFIRPARLEIVPAQAISPSEELTFAVAGSAGEVRLFAPVPDWTPLTMLVFATGTYGVVPASQSTWEDLWAHPPTELEAQFDHALGAVVGAARRQGQAALPAVQLAGLELMRRYGHSRLGPQLVAALAAEDLRVIEPALVELAAFQQQLEAWGVWDETVVTQLSALAEHALTDGLPPAAAACVQAPGLAAMQPVLRAVRLGNALAQAAPSTRQAAVAQASACVGMELRFDSTITRTWGWDQPKLDNTSLAQVAASVPITLTADGQLQGEGPIEVVHTGGQPQTGFNSRAGWIPCLVTAQPKADVLRVERLELPLNLLADGTFPPLELRLVYHTGAPDEGLVHDCGNITDPAASFAEHDLRYYYTPWPVAYMYLRYPQFFDVKQRSADISSYRSASLPDPTFRYTLVDWQPASAEGGPLAVWSTQGVVYAWGPSTLAETTAMTLTLQP